MNGPFEEWTLIYPKRPWTTNKDRTMYPHARAKLVKEWRAAFTILAQEAGIPELEVMYVEVTPMLGDRRLQDTAACNPAAKAAIDGLVDAGIIPDDKNEWLKWIKFHPCLCPPEVPRGKNGLMLKVIGVVKTQPSS